MGRPLIISASRRTDLPGYHAASCKSRILGKISRLRTRSLYGVVFWSRHVGPFLKGGPLYDLVAHQLDNPVLNLTITGLGGTRLEPGAPGLEETLEGLPSLVRAFHGDPWRIRWRFDPLLKGHSSIRIFRKIADTMSILGVPTCTFSFPAYFSLKGDLTPLFDEAGIPRWEPAEKEAVIHELVEIARPRGILLLSCSQPENLTLHPYIREAQCIPRDVLERGHPEGISLDLPKDPSQRSKCTCIESDDIGNYETDRCGGGCVYCYSKAGGPKSETRKD